MCDDECVQNIVIIIGLHDKNMNPLHLINTMINIVLSIKMSVIRSGLLIDKVDVFSGCICSLMLLLCVMNVVVG